MEFWLSISLIAILLTFTRLATVTIHELGHTLAGVILLKGDFSVYIGSHGDPQKGIHFKLARIKVHLKYNPLLWNHGLCVPEQDKNNNTSLIRNYLFVLAGPLASLVTSLICLYILFIPEMHNTLKVLTILMLLSTIWDFYQNIVPNEKPIVLYDGHVTYNDGQSLKMLKQNHKLHSVVTRLLEYFNQNEVIKGLDLFNKTHLKVKNENILRIGAALHMKAKNYSDTKIVFEELAGITDLTSDDYCNLGLAYSFLDDHHRALELYEKSLALNPDNIYGLNNRGYTYNLLERYDEAILDFNKVVELNPKFAYAFNNRGLSKIKKGNHKEGLMDINLSMELDDQNSYAYKNLGIYHNENGECEKALLLFNKAYKLDAGTHGLDLLIADTEIIIKNRQSANIQ